MNQTFVRYLEEAIGKENALVAFSAFDRPASVSVRLNPFKKSPMSFEGRTVSWSPYGLMLEFCEIYGIEDTVFSPTLAEGDLGYANDEFFELVFGEKPYSVSDYAVVFLSDLDFVGECALLLCYSEGDALDACLLLRERIDLLKSMGTGMDTSYLADAVVFKSGRYAVLCALSDNVKAEKTWRKLL
jgi:hypothetical protein